MSTASVNAPGSPKAAGSTAISRAFWRCSRPRGSSEWNDEKMGAPTSTLVSSSKASDIPEPLTPPSGSGMTAWSGSVVGVPSAVAAAPSGKGVPFAFAWRILPSAMGAVAMSRSRGARLSAGTATASGLVATAAPFTPV